MVDLRVIDASKWQLKFNGIGLIIYSYEYDAHPDCAWIALDSGGRYPIEVSGKLATEIYLKLATSGVKGKLFKEKNYIYKGSA
jgi:hypothetical protein